MTKFDSVKAFIQNYVKTNKFVRFEIDDESNTIVVFSSYLSSDLVSNYTLYDYLPIIEYLNSIDFHNFYIAQAKNLSNIFVLYIVK